MTLTRLSLDLVTSLYLGFVILCGIVYTGFSLTPSADGSTRGIRADERAEGTPY
jgi:hypothetical protein